MSRPIVVLGSGGHAKVVIATAKAMGREVLAALDGNPSRHGDSILGIPIPGDFSLAANYPDAEFILAIGDNSTRARLAETLALPWATLIHPSAVIAASHPIGEGTVIFAGAVVQPDTKIGRHVILNTSCSIDHDGVVGDFAHLAPGVHLSGNVTIGEGVLMGVGSCGKPGVTIAPGITVGAGAAVVTNLHEPGTYVGVPARLRLGTR